MGKVIPFRRRVKLTLLNDWIDLMKPDEVLKMLETRQPPDRPAA